MASMRILDLVYRPVRIYLKEPFVIANENYSYCDVMVIKIKTDGFEGVGEAAPDEVVTGENIKTVFRALGKLKKTLVKSHVDDIGETMYKLGEILPLNRTAKAGVDIALYDAMGKHTGKSVSRLLGGRKLRMETSVTIGITRLEDSVMEAVRYKRDGFKVLKVKVGLDACEDERRLRLIREAVGERIRIIVDANQGYSVKEAISFTKRTRDIGINFVEQPVRADDLKGLKAVRDASDIPIMADESLNSPEDLARIIKIKAADMINIKLMKVGGISAALEMARTAKENGIMVMTGCMDETKVGITAGMHFSTASSGVDLVDLDSYLSHRNEIAVGGVATIKGVNRIYNEPGLGLMLKEGVL
jgi:L-alanine-DL-glutamate epimerase-like enolase superfamily enzyme